MYGTGIDRELYLRPPKAQNLPDTRVSPAFYVDDPSVRVLGMAASTERPGLVVKEMGGWRSVYSAAPVLSWEVLRNMARWAGVHLYTDGGDMVWANNAFVAVYPQSDGPRTIRLPRVVDIEDAYEGTLLAARTNRLDLEMRRWHPRLFLLHEPGTR